jgi:hypothetical protein
MFITQFSMNAQSFYLKTGRNFTNYTFTDAQGTTTKLLLPDMGNSYIIGFATAFPNNKLNHNGEHSRFSYEFGMSLDEYNSAVGVTGSSLKWKTEYAGLNNAFLFSLLKTKFFVFDAKVGLNIGGIVYGKEEINGIIHDLKDIDGFRGILFCSNLGIQVKFLASENGYITLGYENRRSLNTTTVYPEKFSMESNQVSIGVYFKIKNSNPNN